MTAALEWTTWEHQHAQVAADVSLHYIDVGPRNATPLVLVHGWPDLWFGWRHQIGPLSEKYRVIAPDMRGYGRSSAPKEISKYGAKTITSDLARLLDILEIEKAVFIGHDWGGSIVWRMCLYHPQRVLAACGICTPYLPPTPQLVDVDALVAIAPQFAYMKLLSQAEETAKQLDSAPRRLFTAMFKRHYELGGADVSVVDMLRGVAQSDQSAYTVRSDLLTEEELDYYVTEYTHSGFQPNLNWYATRPLDFENERGLPLVIPHKALFIGAKNDPVLKPEMAAHMPQLMPNLEMTILDDAGHWVLWEQREKVTETLLNWLDKVDSAAP